MHDNDTKDRFIELRAAGKSLASIASNIGVSKSTLIDWNRRLQPEIRQLRALEFEAFYEKTVASRKQEVTSMVSFLKKIEHILDIRTFGGSPDKVLFDYYLLFRRELRDMRSELAADLDQPLSPTQVAPTQVPATAAAPDSSPGSDPSQPASASPAPAPPDRSAASQPPPPEPAKPKQDPPAQPLAA